VGEAGVPGKARRVLRDGRGAWKYADSLETLANDTLTLYLASNNNATDVFHSGMLQAARGGSMAADSWTYDPLRTEAGEADQADDAASLISQRSAFNLFGEGTIYHSEGFPAATEISGFVKLTLWLTMDVPDTDLGVELWELLPDGSAAFLSMRRWGRVTGIRCAWRNWLRR
jgi:uncharacterized protein